MIYEITFDEVPSFTIVKNRIQKLNPKIEIVKAQKDQAPFHYLLHIQLTINSTLRVSKELLDDLPGKNNDRRIAELDQEIRQAIHRMM